MSEHLPEIYLARHGETAWSLSGQHTGRTDIPLTEKGERDAMSLKRRLAEIAFSEVYFSPLQRARRTCELAGFEEVAHAEPDLVEWDYGKYEGLRTAEIRLKQPGWYIFRDGCPDGESLVDVGARADRVIARLRKNGGRILLFGHGHFSRILAARWIGLPPEQAKHLMLSTAALSILSYEHSLDDPTIFLWNDCHHLIGPR